MTGYGGWGEDEEVRPFRRREDDAQVPGVDNGAEVDTTSRESKLGKKRRPGGQRGG